LETLGLMAYELNRWPNSHAVPLRSDGSAVVCGQSHNGQCDIPDLDYQAVSGQCAIVAVGDNDGQHNIPPIVE
jgi:hypothetical protein